MPSMAVSSLLAAALVLTPGTPLGLLTNAVQALAGVLLPSATVFLLLLCNDEAVLGPWVNGRPLNLFTGAVIAVLVMLSIILTASVLFPDMGEKTILATPGRRMVFTLAIAAALLIIRREDRRVWTDAFGRMIWRMPPLDQLPPAQMTPLTRIMAERPARLSRRGRRACALADRRTCYLGRLSAASCAREKTAHAALRLGSPSPNVSGTVHDTALALVEFGGDRGAALLEGCPPRHFSRPRSWQPWAFEPVRYAPRVPHLMLVHSRVDANLAPGEKPPQKS